MRQVEVYLDNGVLGFMNVTEIKDNGGILTIIEKLEWGVRFSNITKSLIKGINIRT